MTQRGEANATWTSSCFKDHFRFKKFEEEITNGLSRVLPACNQYEASFSSPLKDWNNKRGAGNIIPTRLTTLSREGVWIERRKPETKDITTNTDIKRK